MMLHQDGSRHDWLAGQPALDLIVTMDDATSAIYSAFLVEEEGTASTFRALAEVFGAHGLPLSLYTDRGSHYFHTPKAGGKVDRARLTQVGRALAHLGVEHIAAYSPQARGRSERAVSDLAGPAAEGAGAWRGITTMEAANALLRDVYIPAHNARFAVAAEQEGRPSSPFPASIWPRSCASRRSARSATTIASRSTGSKLQIPESPLAPISSRPGQGAPLSDGTHAIFHGPRCLGRYDSKGVIEVDKPRRLNPLGGRLWKCGQG